LLKIDISKPAYPVLIGSFDTAGEAVRVTISGEYIFVADTFSLMILR